MRMRPALTASRIYERATDGCIGKFDTVPIPIIIIGQLMAPSIALFKKLMMYWYAFRILKPTFFGMQLTRSDWYGKIVRKR